MIIPINHFHFLINLLYTYVVNKHWQCTIHKTCDSSLTLNLDLDSGIFWLKLNLEI